MIGAIRLERAGAPASLSFASSGSSGAGRDLRAARKSSAIRSIIRLDSGSDNWSAMLCASWARSSQRLGSSRTEWDAVIYMACGPQCGGTIPSGAALHTHVDRRHAYVKRMPPACRRMPEARE
jgi:hypothetical protein